LTRLLCLDATHILPRHASELHAPLDLVQQLALSHDVMHVLQQTRRNGTRVAGVGVQRLDDLFDGDRGFADTPGVIVS
jgi:hypothetical protein